MVEPSGAALMANSSGITVEVFSTNVALLRENIDQMFVLLTGAIICFLQVRASLTFSLMDTNPHRYPFLFKGWIWDARSRLGPVEKHNKHPHQEFWGPLLRGCLLLPRWLWSCLQRGQRLGGRQLVAQLD